MRTAPILICDNTSDVPFKRVICPRCNGKQKRQCGTCSGTGKVKIADPSRMTHEQRLRYARAVHTLAVGA